MAPGGRAALVAADLGIAEPVSEHAALGDPWYDRVRHRGAARRGTAPPALTPAIRPARPC
jgi:hypothetical protein